MHTLVGGGGGKEKIQTSPGVPLSSPMSANCLNSGAPGAAVPDTQQEYYELQTAGDFEIPTSVDTFDFIGTTSGSPVEVEVYYGGTDPNNLIQTVELDFPSASGWPVPRGEPTGVNLKTGILNGATPVDVTDPSLWVKVGSTGYNGGAVAAFQTAMKRYYWFERNSFYTSDYSLSPSSTWTYQTTLQAAWSFASRLAWSRQASYSPYQPQSSPVLNYYSNRWRQIVQPGDTIRSLVFCDTPTTPFKTNSGDLRIAALSNRVTGFMPHPDWSGPQSRACMLRLADGTMYFPVTTSSTTSAPSSRPFGQTFTGTDYTKEGVYGNHVTVTTSGGKFQTNRAMGNLPYGGGATPTKYVNGVIREDGRAGDFDTGVGNFPDGPFANKQDEGNVIYAYQEPVTLIWRYPVPYYGTWTYEAPGNTFTSPSRQMPSAGMMGSLPTRVADKKGWQTLSFSPVPAGINHPGNADPKDHLLLDLFQMPVVEPYPISEPFSTAGKVNLNYQIAPFSYITRSTALRAALHPLRVPILAVGTGSSANYLTYKTGVSSAADAGTTYDKEKGQNKPNDYNPRKPVDRDLTIKNIDEFFKLAKTDSSTGFFKSGSQICERCLYPKGVSATDDTALKSYWANSSTLIGDNMREKPYTDLVNRVTSKSNTYTVHMRVQTLRQLPRSNPTLFNTWNEGRDAVLGEYRGATTIERYIDPADPRFKSTNANFVNPDDTTSSTNLETLYRVRAVSNKRFAP
jgi:uncharacterized protein (TIGR02600 family)